MRTAAVGLEATLDIWTTFSDLSDFEKFVQGYKGQLATCVKKGCTTIAKSKGDEIPIDGKLGEAQKLIDRARQWGANIEYSLGGNGAQEAAALKALGADVVFLGNIFPHQITKVPLAGRKFFERCDFDFSATSDQSPASIILQARGTNRYILCQGAGRRIEHLRDYISKLPKVLMSVMNKYGGLDIVSLVGWHVIFANGITTRDFRMIAQTIKEVRSVVKAPIFTDAGSLAPFNLKERNALYQLYSLFDVLSLNEDELVQLCGAVGLPAKDEISAMSKLLKNSVNLSTVWLHSLDYQVSMSKKIESKLLKKAQRIAAAAGVCRVEKGVYPTMKDIENRMKVKNYSERGLEKVKTVEKMYGQKIDDFELAVTPCYNARSFESTVGAGDVAAATYAYVLSSAKNISPTLDM